MTNKPCPKYLISDKECVLRAQKGEYDVLRVLYERYYPDVLQFVNSKISELTDAQDVCSQVFDNVIEDINKLKKPDCFQKWLYKIVSYKIFDFYRNREKNTISLQADIDVMSLDEQYEKMDKQIQEKLHNSVSVGVKNTMRQLKPKERQILELSIEWGYTSAEIAQKLGKGESAVKMLLKRTKTKFVKLYLQKYKSPIYLGGEKNEKE
jgi:RNA polymerase sigma-70 factor (ECF subfamily)